MKEKAHIVVIGTGGTIAGRGASSVNTSAYACSVLSIDEVLSGIPEVAAVSRVSAEQLMQIGSEIFTTEHLLQLGKRILEGRTRYRRRVGIGLGDRDMRIGPRLALESYLQWCRHACCPASA